MKDQRLNAIREVLRVRCDEQDELRRSCDARNRLTQATLSRDMHELRLMKDGGIPAQRNGACRLTWK